MKKILIILLAFFAIGCKAQIYLGSAYKFGQYIIVKDSVTTPLVHCDSLHTVLINTNGNVPLVLKVNNVEYARFEQDSGNIFLGSGAGRSSINFNINSIGNSSCMLNTGRLINAFGMSACKSNTGQDINSFGNESCRYNIGDYVNAFGQKSAMLNEGLKVIAIGDSAAFGNTLNNLIQIGQGDSTTAFIWGINRHGIAGARVHINALPIIKQLTGALTDGTPTVAEINGIAGRTAAQAGAGFQVTIKDNNGTGLLYRCESDGTDWYYVAMTKAL